MVGYTFVTWIKKGNFVENVVQPQKQKTAGQLAVEKHLTEPHQGLAAFVNGEMRDLSI